MPAIYGGCLTLSGGSTILPLYSFPHHHFSRSLRLSAIRLDSPFCSDGRNISSSLFTSLLHCFWRAHYSCFCRLSTLAYTLSGSPPLCSFSYSGAGGISVSLSMEVPADTLYTTTLTISCRLGHYIFSPFSNLSLEGLFSPTPLRLQMRHAT